MKTVAVILELAAPLTAGFHIRIENEPWMTLVIEDTQERGPNGLPAISVAHYGEQNGDLMRDPEMIFEAEESGDEMNLVPYYWRNDYAGVEQYSASTEDEQTLVNAKLRREHIAFAGTWDANLKAQGFLEAFVRQQKGDT
jgi:Domain of unknown function (DUF6908)